MFNNIGGKVKGLAVVTSIIGIIASVIYGLVCLSSGLIVAGIITLIVGPLSSWISCWVLYAIGESAETAYYAEIAANRVNELRQEVFELREIVNQRTIAPNDFEPDTSNIPSNSNGIEEKVEPEKENITSSFDSSMPVVIETTTDDSIECPRCSQKQPKNRYLCFKCATRFINKNVVTVPYWCNKCGKAGPFDDNCPECGSSIKVYR